MDRERTAATAGVAACLLTAGSVAAPYLLVSENASVQVGTYYGAGPVNPLAVGLVAVIGAIIFAAGREGRSDPDLVAGIMLPVGAFSTVVAAVWVGAFDPALITDQSTLGFFSTHRWTVLAGGALEAAAAAWYAAARGLVPVPWRGESVAR